MADLSGLALLRNDPDNAARLIAAAEEGDVDAQYAAGLIYAEGRGVAIDPVQAYYWLTRAMRQGDGDAERLRMIVAAGMDDLQFASAKRLLALAARASGAGDAGTRGH